MFKPIGSLKEFVAKYNFCKTDIDLHNNDVTCPSRFVCFALAKAKILILVLRKLRISC